MNSITVLCKETSDGAEYTGTKVIISFLAVVVEITMLCYTIYHLCLLRRKTKVYWIFRALLFSYHTFCMLYIVSSFARFIIPMFNINNIHDMSSIFVCYKDAIFNILFFGCVYLSTAMYWLFRLKLTFSGSHYQSSNKFYNFMTCWAIFGALIGLTLSIICFTIIIKDNKNSENYFCLTKVNVQDFFPYLVSANSQKYRYKLDNFYKCAKNRNNSIWILTDLSTYIGVVCVPAINGVLFYQYTIKMKRFVLDFNKHGLHQVNKVNKHHIEASMRKKGQFVSIYKNVLIGVSSISSTFIAIILYIFNSKMFGILFYIDVIINGLFMIMVLKFGQWMFCKCCRNFILKSINSQYDNNNSDNNKHKNNNLAITTPGSSSYDNENA